LPEVNAKVAAAQGALKERPLPRLLQQLYRKKFTGHFVITDGTGDESQVYLREGSPVHVCRPVDTDRLDNIVVEYGLVPAQIVAQAGAQVGDGSRLGDVLERMGALNREKLAQVLKTQVMRKLTRLFFVVEGTYAVYVSAHGFGEGGDLPLMRVDPRSVIYPGIRAAYDLPRVTRELARLAGERFRLADISSAFVAAMGISPDDVTVEFLRRGWMTLDDLDAVTSRPFEVRSVVLAMYYSDLLEREAIAQPLADPVVPQSSERESVAQPLADPIESQSSAPSRPSGVYRVSRLSLESGKVFDLGSTASAEGATDRADPAPVPAADAAPVPVADAAPVVAPASVPAKAAPPAPAPVPASVPAPAVGLPPAVVAFARPQPAPASTRPPGTMPVASTTSTRPSGTMPAVTASTPAAWSPRTPSAANGSGAPGGGLGGPVSPSVPIVRSSFVSTVRAGVKTAPATPANPAPRASSVPGPEVVRANIQEMAQKLDKSTHFEILGVGQNATADEVGTAFVRAARQFHPDRLTSAGLADLQPLAEKILARINEAAMVLGNSTRRAEYVASLAPGAQAQQNLPSLLEAENMFLKGEVFLKKGDYSKAIDSFALAVQGNPSEPQYQAYLAWSRFDDPRARKEAIVRETLKTLEGVLKERPKFARGFYWVGQLWKFLNESGKAEEAFREAVQIDSSFIEASRELRLIEMRKGKAPARKAGAKGDGSKGKFWKK
jgi:curved DNA-binding protein CbpA